MIKIGLSFLAIIYFISSSIIPFKKIDYQEYKCRYDIALTLHRKNFNSEKIEDLSNYNDSVYLNTFIVDNFYLTDTSVYLQSLSKVNVTSFDFIISNEIKTEYDIKIEGLNSKELYKFSFWIINDMNNLNTLFFVILMVLAILQVTILVILFYKKF